MTDLATYAVTLARILGIGVRQRMAQRDPLEDAGIGTLEMVIIALGLMAIAGILVAGLTAAVTRRTSQIK